MNTNKGLAQARALTIPSRQAILKRNTDVSQFWNSNRKLLEDAWVEWEIENNADLPLLDETFLDPYLRKAINEA